MGRGVLLVSLFASGCTQDSIPLEPTLASLDANVFQPRCTWVCHSGGEYAAGGLDLSDFRTATFGVPATSRACEDTGLALVVPGDPDASLLVLKVSAATDGEDAICGDGMPNGFRHPLSTTQVDTIREWIVAGGED